MDAMAVDNQKKNYLWEETHAIPSGVARQFRLNAALWEEISARLCKSPPPFAMTVARGSAVHAAMYTKYLLESFCGLVTSTGAPSVLTLYDAQLQLRDSLVLGISQAGQSEELCEMLAYARAEGAVTVALLNHTASPLAEVAEYVIPLHMGEEAHPTLEMKTCLASMCAMLQLMSIYSEQEAILPLLDILPFMLSEALEIDWDSALPLMSKAKCTLVLGRGYHFPVVREVAAKLKSVVKLPAEAFSGAHAFHDISTLLSMKPPVWLFLQNDASLEGMCQLAERVKLHGGTPFVVAPKGVVEEERMRSISTLYLPAPPSSSSFIDPLITLQMFYKLLSKMVRREQFTYFSPEIIRGPDVGLPQLYAQDQ